MKKRILFFGKDYHNYIAFEPIYKQLKKDKDIVVYFTSKNTHRFFSNSIYRELGLRDEKLINHHLAPYLKCDIYISPDMMMLGKRCRVKIHTFHGVSFKGKAYSDKVYQFDKLFIVGEYMRRRFIEKGILKENDPLIEKIGMPKTDALVDGSLNRNEIISQLQLDPNKPTILYAPTWRKECSLYTIGEELMSALSQSDKYNFLIKLHDICYDLKSNPIDWRKRLKDFESKNTRIINEYNITPYLFITDVLISDASSVANEFLLLDRPIIFVDVPKLFKKYEQTIDLDTWGQKTGIVSETVDDVAKAIEESLRQPMALSDIRHQAAADIFYNPGKAASIAAETIYNYQ